MKKCPICSTFYDDSAIKCGRCNVDLVSVDTQAPPPPYYTNPYSAPQGKYCQRCGNFCDPRAAVCVKCGTPFSYSNQFFEPDEPSTGLKVLCFFIPFVALILYIINNDKKPISAKEYGKWGLIGLAVNFVAQIFIWVLSFALVFFETGYYF